MPYCSIARLNPRVRHHRRDHEVAVELPVLLHLHGARGEDLVAVDDVSVRVGEQRPVGIAVVRDAGVRAFNPDRFGDDFRMKGSARDVDVRTVGLGEDRVDLRAEATEGLGRDVRCCAVRAIDHDAHAVEACQRRSDHVVDVVGRTRRDVEDAAGRSNRTRLRAEVRLDLVLELVRELEPVGVEELDAVVLGRVVRSGDDHAGARVHGGGEERDGRSRLDADEVDVAAARRDALDERFLQRPS